MRAMRAQRQNHGTTTNAEFRQKLLDEHALAHSEALQLQLEGMSAAQGNLGISPRAFGVEWPPVNCNEHTLAARDNDRGIWIGRMRNTTTQSTQDFLSFWLNTTSTTRTAYASLFPNNPYINVFGLGIDLTITAHPDCLSFDVATIGTRRPDIPFYSDNHLRGVHHMKFFVEVVGRGPSDASSFSPAKEGQVLDTARELLEELPQRQGVLCCLTDSVRYRFYRVTRLHDEIRYEMSSVFLSYLGYAVSYLLL